MACVGGMVHVIIPWFVNVKGRAIRGAPAVIDRLPVLFTVAVPPTLAKWPPVHAEGPG